VIAPCYAENARRLAKPNIAESPAVGFQEACRGLRHVAEADFGGSTGVADKQAKMPRQTPKESR
jgi:hypothetical protein